MDDKAEVKHVNLALGKCGYPSWIFKKVRQQLDKQNSTPKKPKNKKDTDKKEESPIMVSIPNVKGAHQCHGVSTAIKTHLILKHMLVHLKDKRTQERGR